MDRAARVLQSIPIGWASYLKDFIIWPTSVCRKVCSMTFLLKLLSCIEVLAERANFLEVAFLTLYGELPNSMQLNSFSKKVMEHTFLHTDVGQMMKSFRYDAHPMGMLCSTLAALSTVHP